MTPEQERQELARLGRFRDALDGFNWGMEVDRDGAHIVASRARGDAARIATIHPAASPDELEILSRALDILRFTLGLIRRARLKIRSLQPGSVRGAEPEKPAENAPDNKPKPKNFGLSAKWYCGQPPFRRFLEERSGGLTLPDEASADAELKRVLRIQSKSELNQPGRARDAWLDLTADYGAWIRV